MRLRNIGVAIVLLSTACLPVDDGFRAKLAAGCSTREACDALDGRAQERFQSCMKTSSTGRDCNDQMQDRFSASQQKSRQQEADEKTRGGGIWATAPAAQNEARQTRLKAEQEAAAKTALEEAAACAANRADRVATIRAALCAAATAKQENSRKADYIKAHCRLVRTPIYENQMRADPGTGIVRVVPVQVNMWESTKCPAGTPKDIVDADGEMVPVPIATSVAQAARNAIARSAMCHDLDASNPDAPEFALACSPATGSPTSTPDSRVISTPMPGDGSAQSPVDNHPR